MTKYSRTDYAGPSYIIGALLVGALFFLMVPPLILFLPVAIVVMTVLYLVWNKSLQTAKGAADRRAQQLGGSKLYLELDTLVLNDWGAFYAKFGKPLVELPWQQITSVTEPQIAFLEFHAGDRTPIRIDLSQYQYFAAIWAIHSKLPNRTEFQVDPVSCTLNLLPKLQREPFEFRGKFGHVVVTNDAISRSGIALRWKEIRSVEEVFHSDEDMNAFWTLTVRTDSQSFLLNSGDFLDGPQLWDTDYDLIKTLIALKIPDKTKYHRRLPTAKTRAIEEYERCQEIAKVGFSIALKSGKFAPCERYLSHMTALVDKVHIEDEVDTRSLFQDYAELLDRTNRPSEAAKMHDRAKVAPR
jgi:hypothetical protein